MKCTGCGVADPEPLWTKVKEGVDPINCEEKDFIYRKCASCLGIE